MMSQLNRPLEAFSGAWTILAAFCCVFLILHIVATGNRRALSWRRWTMDLPPGTELALAVLVICAAELLTRGSIWYWRRALGGEPARLVDFGLLLAFGALLGISGFLCILRVVSRAYGPWPTASACIIVLAYLATVFL